MREVKVTINPDGTIITDFNGFVGSACLREADQLRTVLAQLGIESIPTQMIPKPELKQEENVHHHTHRQKENS